MADSSRLSCLRSNRFSLLMVLIAFLVISLHVIHCCLHTPLCVLFLLCLIGSFFRHYIRCCCSKTVLHSPANCSLAYLVRKFSSVHQNLFPTPLALGPFSQTHLTWLVRFINVQRCQFRTDDTIARLDWLIGRPHVQFRGELDHIKPIVLFVPSLFEPGNHPLQLSLMIVSHEVGYRSVAVHSQTCCRLLPDDCFLKRKLKPDYLQEITKYLKQKYKVRLVGIGIGLGSTCLANYLIRHGKNSFVDAAFLVSAVFDLNKMITRMSNFWLGRRILNHWCALAHQINFEEPNLFQSIFPSKEDVTSPTGPTHSNVLSSACSKWFSLRCLLAFSNGSTQNNCQLFSGCSSLGQLHRIKVPTFYLNSGDDPMNAEIPFQEIQHSSNQAILITARGGHAGFVDRLNVNFFVEILVEEFLTTLISLVNLPTESSDLNLFETLKNL